MVWCSNGYGIKVLSTDGTWYSCKSGDTLSISIDDWKRPYDIEITKEEALAWMI